MSRTTFPTTALRRLGSFIARARRFRAWLFPASGGDSWAIIANNAIYTHNINNEAFSGAAEADGGGANRGHTDFICAEWRMGDLWPADLTTHATFTNACFQQIGIFENEKWLVEHVAFTHTDGWSVISNTPMP